MICARTQGKTTAIKRPDPAGSIQRYAPRCTAVIRKTDLAGSTVSDYSGQRIAMRAGNVLYSQMGALDGRWTAQSCAGTGVRAR